MNLFSFFKFGSSNMVYEDAFDEATRIPGKPYGGRFIIEKQKKEDQALFRTLKRITQADIIKGLNRPQILAIGKMPYVHFDIIDSPLFNATAAVKDDKEFIGLNYGLVLLIHDIFNRMLSRKDVLPEIGSIDLEENPEPLPQLTGNYDDIQMIHDTFSLSPLIIPKDPVRREHAALLANFAITFLVHHEFDHLTNGHVHYIYNITGRSSLLEVETNLDEKVSDLTRKVLEWDADSGATNFGIHRIGHLLNDPSYFIEIREKFNKIESGVLFFWFFAIWVLFRLMDENRRVGDKPSTWYPTPAQRLISVLATANTVILRCNYKFNEETLSTTLPSVIAQAEEAISLISVKNHRLGLVEMATILQFKKVKDTFLEGYQKHWKKVVRPRLVPYARNTDLPA